MSVRASLRNYRVSAQKARLVADLVRGRRIEEALDVLGQSSKRVAVPIAKLLRSAVANVEDRNRSQKAGIDIDNLIVQTINVDEGPSMWRIRARAQGRASWVQKRTSHITVVLDEK